MVLEEEEYFPRGGSSGKISTKKNFVFESRKQNKEPKKKLGKRERKRLKRDKALPSSNINADDDENEEEKEENFDFGRDVLNISAAEPRLKKVNLLSYQALTDGMLMLCSVNTILAKSLRLSLPERLLCTVGLNDISTPLSSGITTSSGKLKSIDLKKIFSVGDILACKIISVQKKSDSFEVLATTDPVEINSELSFSDVHVGNVFLGAVKSVEDHGYMIFSGVNNMNVFLPFENCSTNPESQKLKKPFVVGKLLWCKVVKSILSDSANNVQVSINPEDFGSHPITEDTISNNAVLPGMELDLTVTKHLGDDLEVSVQGIEGHGFVPHSHFKSIADEASKFKVGSIMKGTVLYKYPISDVAAFSLRVSPTTATDDVLETGEVIERAEIVCHDKRGLGVKFIRSGRPCYGFISRRRMQGDVHSKRLDQLFPKGNHLTVVIIGYHQIDQLYSCSTENELLTGKFLTMTHLKEMVGKAVTVVVKGIKENGAVVMIDNRTAFVPDTQITDTRGGNPLKKLQINSKQKGRLKSYKALEAHKFVTSGHVKSVTTKDYKVIAFGKILRVDPEKNAILVTLRPTFVHNKPLTDFSKVSKGEAYYGSVMNNRNDGISVGFFNGLKADIKQENLIQECQKYKSGDLVKCYVVRESHNSRPPTFSLVRFVDQMLLSIGLTYKLIVKESSPKGIVCLLEEKNNIMNVQIPLQHLADDPSLQKKQLETLTLGSTVDGHLFCFDSQLNPVFTLRDSVKQFFETGGEKLLNEGYAALKVRTMIPVILAEEVEEGFYVSVPVPKYNGKVLVPKEEIGHYRNVSIGDVLWLSVKSIILTDKRFSLEFPLVESHARPLKHWAVSNLRSYLNTVSKFQTFKPCEKVSAVGTGSSGQCRLQDGRKGIIERCSNEEPVTFAKGRQLELTFIHEDLVTGAVHLVQASPLPLKNGAVTYTKKFRPVFIAETFFVGKADDGSVCFCPRFHTPASTKPDVTIQKLSRDKSLTVELCYNEGELWIGHIHVNMSADESGIGVQPRESAKKRKKRNKSLNNKPNGNMKKAKLTLVTSNSPDRVASVDSDALRLKKVKRKKSLKGNNLSFDSNPLLVNSEYNCSAFD